MNRREFILLLGATAVTWPLAARAQLGERVRRIGFLLPGVARTMAVRGQLEAFRQGLKEYGWVEGQNIIVSTVLRGAKGRASGDRCRVGSIAVGCHRGGRRRQSAAPVTQTVPIIMATSADPVGKAWSSLNRPGANITVESQTGGTEKRLQLLTEIVPGLARLAVCRSVKCGIRPNYRANESQRIPAGVGSSWR